MKSILYIIILLGGGSIFFTTNNLPKNPAKYLNLNIASDQMFKAEKAFVFSNPDTLLDHQMYVIQNSKGTPLLYYADIKTPVCIDNICKPLYIEMYWDLTGEYIGYGEYPDQLLSKYDHDDFEEENYEKLHNLLSDAHSIIGRRNLRGLYDIQTQRTETIKFKGQEIDGVTGATKKEIKSTIVEGALYSCYTLWHIAYGDAIQKIKSRLPSMYDTQLENYFLSSDWLNYNMYATKNLPANKYETHLKDIIKIIKSANPISRSYILKKMPKEIYSHHAITQTLYPHFSEFDFNSKSILLQSLSHANPTSYLSIAEQVSGLSKNQLKIYFNLLKKNPALITAPLKEKLKIQSKNDNFINAYVVQSFLNEIE